MSKTPLQVGDQVICIADICQEMVYQVGNVYEVILILDNGDEEWPYIVGDDHDSGGKFDIEELYGEVSSSGAEYSSALFYPLKCIKDDDMEEFLFLCTLSGGIPEDYKQ